VANTFSSASGNIIAFNSTFGVAVDSGSGNAIHQNSIFGNGGLGIKLAAGANNDAPAPALTSVSVVPTGTIIAGTLNATANTDYVLEFYLTPNAGAGQGETQTFFTTVTTDSSGAVSFTAATGRMFPAGGFVPV